MSTRVEVRNNSNPVTIVMGDTSGTIVSATAVTGAPGTDASVTLGGTPAARTIEFTIPRGATGTGATIVSATAVTGAAGSAASVTLGGTASARTFTFSIPAGAAATVAVGTVTTGAAGSAASVTNSGDDTNAILDFTIPKGDKGDKGDTGESAETAFTSKTADYQMLDDDHFVEVTANNVSITFPTAVGRGANPLVVKNTGTGVVTILTLLGQTVDGYASGAIQLYQNDAIVVASNGTNYLIR